MTAGASEPPYPLTVALDSLGRAIPSDLKGGQAVILDLPDYRLPGNTNPMVLKLYHRKRRQRIPRPPALELIVNIRWLMDHEGRRTFDRRCVWPLQVVVDDRGRTAGVVMPRIPERFFYLVERYNQAETRPRDVQAIAQDRERAQRNGAYWPSPTERVVALREVAGFLGQLHSLGRDGIVYGDLNPLNIAFAFDGPANDVVRVMDCDAARPFGSGVFMSQLDFPDWNPPEVRHVKRSHANKNTDRYKFGVLVLRVLTPGYDFSYRMPSRDALRSLRSSLRAAGLDEKLGSELVLQAMSDAPDDRVPLLSWYRYLKGDSVVAVAETLPAATLEPEVDNRRVPAPWAHVARGRTSKHDRTPPRREAPESDGKRKWVEAPWAE